jgi:hypothetical protein
MSVSPASLALLRVQLRQGPADLPVPALAGMILLGGGQRPDQVRTTQLVAGGRITVIQRQRIVHHHARKVRQHTQAIGALA